MFRGKAWKHSPGTGNEMAAWNTGTCVEGSCVHVPVLLWITLWIKCIFDMIRPHKSRGMRQMWIKYAYDFVKTTKIMIRECFG